MLAGGIVFLSNQGCGCLPCFAFVTPPIGSPLSGGGGGNRVLVKPFTARNGAAVGIWGLRSAARSSGLFARRYYLISA